MNNDYTALDDCIEGNDQRELTRVIRTLVYTSSYTDNVVVYGAAPAVSRVIQSLVSLFPHDGYVIGLISDGGKTVQLGPPFSSANEPITDGSVLKGLQAVLRQDPDIVATTSIDSESKQGIFQAAITGHQVIIGIEAADMVGAMAQLVHFVPESPELDSAFTVGIGIEVATSGTGEPRLKRVVKKIDNVLTEVASIDASGAVVVARELLPVVPAPEGPRFVPEFAVPVTERPAATALPRPAFLPRTTPETPVGHSCIGERTVLRPRGTAWPVCGHCQTPLTLVVQLDLDQIPVQLPTPTSGIAQLFLCSKGGENGCDFSGEGLGVHMALYAERSELEAVVAPSEVSSYPLAGTISSWSAYTESPGYDDAEAHGVTVGEGTHPLRCDKLGGWPAWEQAAEWPKNSDGTPMTLLFQYAEGNVKYSGGVSSGWDYEQAKVIPATNGTPVRDDNFPAHFDDLLTGGAVALLFIDKESKQLSFVWQTD